MGKYTSIKARNFASPSKHTVRVINFKFNLKFFHAKLSLREMNILSVYKLTYFKHSVSCLIVKLV